MFIPHLEGFDLFMALITLPARSRFLCRTSLRKVEDHREKQKENDEDEKAPFFRHNTTSC
jgi:hypothetical protein